MDASRLLRTLWLLAVCFSCSVASASASDADSTQQRVDMLPFGVGTKAAVTDFTDVTLTRCIAVSASAEICSWWIGDRSPAWKPLAKAVSTRKKINLLCEFPLDGSPRKPGSCTAHAPFVSKHPKSRRNKGVKLSRQRRDEAQALLDAARTLVELTRLIGEVPSRCRPASENSRVCLWRTVRDTPGYKIVGRILRTTKKVRVRCRLPADGSPRAENSCSLEIGA